MNDAKIVLVDDEKEILEMIQIVLHKEGFSHVVTAETAAEAIKQCKVQQPDVILLDVMLPDGEGFDVCRELRQFTGAPILFLTARTTDLDTLTGFSMGADDYIRKPFNPLEVVARIKAQLRRAQMAEPTAPRSDRRLKTIGHFSIDERAGQLFVDGIEVPCPAMEFKLLCYLVDHPNQVFSKRQLYEQIWEETSLGDDNTVMVHIRRLRKKIERDPSHPQYVVTVRGLGYKLVTD